MFQSFRPLAENTAPAPQTKPAVTTPQPAASPAATTAAAAPAGPPASAAAAEPAANANAAAKVWSWLTDDVKLVKGAFAKPDPDKPDNRPLVYKDGSFTNTKTQTDTSDQGVTNTTTRTISAGKSGASVSNSTNVTTGTGDDATADTTTKTIGVGKDGLTASKSTSASNGSGVSTTTSGNSTSGSLGPSGASFTTSQTSGTGTADNGTSNTTSSTFSAGKSGIGYGQSSSQTTTVDGTSTTNSSGYNISYDPTKGQVTGSGNVTHGDASLNGSLSISGTGIDASATGGYKGATVGLTYDSKQNAVTSDAHTQGDGSLASQSLGNSGYVQATRTDETTIGGSAGFKAVNLSGSVTNGSTIQAFDKLPANWDQMSAADKQKFQDNEKQRLVGVNGLADVNLAQLGEGSGIHYASYNGWNASAGITYGAIGVNGGMGSSSAHDVNIVKNNGQLSFTVQRQDNVSDSVGMSVFQLGLNVSQDKGKAHQFQFDVDPALLNPKNPDGSDNPRYNPQTAQAIKTFQQTGLYPGADKLTDGNSKQAYQKFQDSKGQVDTLNAQIAQLNKQIDAANGQTQDPAALSQNQQKLTALYQQLNVAQTAVDTNRNYLNDQRTAVAQPGQELAPGIKISQTTDVRTDNAKLGVSAPLVGNIGVGESDRTWTDQAYLSAQNKVENRYSYDDKNLCFGNLTQEQSVQTDTNKDAIVLSMYSDNRMSYGGNEDAIRSIRNKNLPDYMLTNQNSDLANLRGRTTVTLTQQQLNAATSSLNDMNNQQSQQMWQGFSQAGPALLTGGQYWDASMNGNQAVVNSMKMQQQDYVNGLMQRDPQKDPLGRALASYGGTQQDQLQRAAAEFQGVKSPADFQKLDPDKQQLYIDLVENSSGSVHDFSGKRNAYDALGPIALISDPQARAQSMRSLFEEENDQGKHEDTDGVYEFVRFTQKFKDDPATYNMLQQGMSFDWKQDDVANYAKQDMPTLVNDMHGAEGAFFGADSDTSLRLLEAANQQGGKAAVEKLIASGGMNLRNDIQRLKHNPAMQKMFMDLVDETSFAKDIQGVDPNA